MTDWGAHYFGGATFAVDIRELQPTEIVLHDDKGNKWVTLKYPNGIVTTTNPTRRIWQSKARPARSAEPSQCRPTISSNASRLKALPRYRAGRQLNGR